MVMSVASLNPEDLSGGHVKIGAPSHLVRNLIVLVAIVGGAAAIWGWSRYSSARDDAKLAPFDQFRALYAEKCSVPSYAGPQPEIVQNAYLTSTPIRDAVAKQMTALQGNASCEDVQAALKSVDFTVPKATPAP
jgi:hypothetical protein